MQEPCRKIQNMVNDICDVCKFLEGERDFSTSTRDGVSARRDQMTHPQTHTGNPGVRITQQGSDRLQENHESTPGLPLLLRPVATAEPDQARRGGCAAGASRDWLRHRQSHAPCGRGRPGAASRVPVARRPRCPICAGAGWGRRAHGVPPSCGRSQRASPSGVRRSPWRVFKSVPQGKGGRRRHANEREAATFP